MHRRHFMTASAVFMLVLLGLIGCKRGDGLERIPLSGTVSFKGEPVADGQIRLRPMPGTTAPLTILTITDGRYDSSSVGGAPVGQYRIEIRSFDPNTPAPKMAGEPQRTQFLPDKFNKNSTMELEVPSGNKTLKQDYDLNP